MAVSSVRRKLGVLAAFTATYLATGFLYGLEARDTDNALFEIFRMKALRAEQSQGPRRILLSGGSNVIWGYRSAVIEAKLGIPTTNLALPSEAGDPAAMRELTLRAARPGDVVVYSSIWFWDIIGVDAPMAKALLDAAGVVTEEAPVERLKQMALRHWAWSPRNKSLAAALPGLYERYVAQAESGYYTPYNEHGDLRTCNKTDVKPIAFGKSPPERAYYFAALRAFRDSLKEKGAQLVIDVSWLYVSNDEREKWAAAFAPQLRELDRQFVVTVDNLHDVLKTDARTFCDSENHLVDQAANKRSQQLASFLAYWMEHGEPSELIAHRPKEEPDGQEDG